MKNEEFSKFVLFLNQKTNYTFGTRLKVTFNEEKKSIDQSMITYFANHSSRQRMNNKPNRVGCKI